MSLSRSVTVLGLAAVPATALAIAGCGGGGGGAPVSAAPANTASGHSATIGVANTSLGKVLVDSQGRTVYLFRKDSGTKSACFGECAKDWPPLRASGKPTVSNGASASMVSTTERSDGKPQVTYNGHPLYLFEGDHNPGDTSGQGLTAFGGGWYVLSPAGTQVTGKSSGSSSSNSGGGSGY